MLKNILPILLLAMLVSNCIKENLPSGDLTNKEQMNLLSISDPLVWNSLVSQSLAIDTTGNGMKAANGINKMKEYPNKGYYFTLFEDLFPSQGDYDFNDVILRTKLYLDGKQGEVWGTITSTVYHKGGTLPTRLGLVIYSVKGNKEYTRIENDQILINGQRLEGTDPFVMDLPKVGEEFNIEYFIEDRTNNINQVWFSWYIIVTSGGEDKEIHSSGFPSSKKSNFALPQMDYLTNNNLPWGLEIEAEQFFVPKERALFLEAFPEFKEWAESEGVKNKSWFENPDLEFIQN